MINKKRLFVILSVCLAAVAITVLPWDEEKIEKYSREENNMAFSFSPGHPGLPFSDSYGSYQWGILNKGVFKLVPGKQEQIESLFEGGLGGQHPDAAGRGPVQESGEIIKAEPGVDINIVPAWKWYAEKSGKRHVTVALVDTGVDYSHEELWNSVWVNRDEVPGDGKDNDENGFIDDMYGWNFYSNNNVVFNGAEDNHGTHSAGTIAAARNGKGIVGINDPEYIKVMILKSLGTAAATGTPKSVAEAIRYAENNGAMLCNLSFGTSKYSEELYQTMKNSKMLFIVAAGNGDSSGKGYNIEGQPVYPAAFALDNMISVASLKMDGTLDPASNYGEKSVDIAAPGHYILSSVPGKKYSYMSGTSMATPMVTGAAALLYSYDPAITTMEVKTRILNSAHKLDSLAGKTVTGGMLDVSAALGIIPGM